MHSAADRPGESAALLPGQPDSITACRYLAGWLEQGVGLSGAAARKFTATLNGLPPGLSRTTDLGLVRCRPAGALGSVDDPLAGDSMAYRIQAHYPDGPEVGLVARVGWCGELGITNGVRTGQCTMALVNLLWDTVGAGYGMSGATEPER